MAKLNRDLLNSVPVETAANATVAVIDRLQDFSPELQMLALTTSYKLMLERFNFPPQDILTVADNVMNHADGRRVEFEAVQSYMEGEL